MTGDPEFLESCFEKYGFGPNFHSIPNSCVALLQNFAETGRTLVGKHTSVVKSPLRPRLVTGGPEPATSESNDRNAVRLAGSHQRTAARVPRPIRFVPHSAACLLVG